MKECHRLCFQLFSYIIFTLRYINSSIINCFFNVIKGEIILSHLSIEFLHHVLLYSCFSKRVLHSTIRRICARNHCQSLHSFSLNKNSIAHSHNIHCFHRTNTHRTENCFNKSLSANIPNRHLLYSDTHSIRVIISIFHTWLIDNQHCFFMS